MAVIRPVRGQQYSAETAWQGEKHRFLVAFGERFCARARQSGAAVDLQTGELVQHVERQDLLGAKAGFETATGETAPPWLFRLPQGTRAFVLPRGSLFVDEERGRVVLEAPGCVPVFRCFEGRFVPSPTFDAPSALTPLPSWQPIRVRRRRLRTCGVSNRRSTASPVGGCMHGSRRAREWRATSRSS